jgi:hypothetical protein
MSTMPSVGLSESPPESKVMALPTITTGGLRPAAPFGIQEIFTSRGSSAEPRVTPRNIPMRRPAISRGPSTSTCSPASLASSRAVSASRVGVRWSGGSFTRSRAQATDPATLRPSATDSFTSLERSSPCGTATTRVSSSRVFFFSSVL